MLDKNGVSIRLGLDECVVLPIRGQCLPRQVPTFDKVVRSAPRQRKLTTDAGCDASTRRETLDTNPLRFGIKAALILEETSKWRIVMVRVEFHDKDDITVMRIEGRFVGDFAEDTKRVVASKKIFGRLVVDMSELSWADHVGEQVLLWLSRIGCLFVAGNTYSSYVCERLNLRLFQEAAGTAPI
jgi:hypothetical protein